MRYVKGSNPVERFVCFVDVLDRTGQGLFEVLKNTLEQYNLQDKPIAQAYDGTNVMSGHTKGVQALMQTIFKNAKFVHCYAHQLNLVLKNACCNIKLVKLFFANLTGFSIFFLLHQNVWMFLGIFVIGICQLCLKHDGTFTRDQ